MINEVIEEEDEDKNNNIIKENDIKKENIEKNNNNEKFRKIMTKNISPFSTINNPNLKNNNKDINKKKPNLIWSNSPPNKKINTYENLLYKKTFDKYVSVRDKLIPTNKNSNNNGTILPDLKNINNINNNYQSINIKKSLNTPKLNLRSLSTDKAKLQQNMNINSITNDTSAFTHSSKKYFSPIGLGIQNYTEDVSKYRMGLLSAGSSSNNNVIIPMIPIRRPVSNFNFGGGQLWNNFENNNITNKNIMEKDMIVDEDKNVNKYLEKENDNNLDKEFPKKELKININNLKKNYNIYNKLSNDKVNKNLKSQDMKNQLEVFPITNDINNLYLDKMINKLHKIKIEKGMMNYDIMNSLNQKLNNDYQNQIGQLKKSNLPMMFNNQNNKMKIYLDNNTIDNNKRSHSFNNKNNFHYS